MKFAIVNSYEDMSFYIDDLEKEFDIEVLSEGGFLYVFAELDNMADVITLKNTVKEGLIIDDYPEWRKKALKPFYPDFEFPQLQIEIYDSYRE